MSNSEHVIAAESSEISKKNESLSISVTINAPSASTDVNLAPGTSIDRADSFDKHTIILMEGIEPDMRKFMDTDIKLGLSDAEAETRLGHFGQLAEAKSKSKLMKFLAYFGGPISILLEIASVISAIARDWADFGILVFVLVLNAVIGYYEEAKAEDALAALKSTLALKCKTVRNGKLCEVDAKELVPGDIISLRLGDIIPADCILLGVGVSGDDIKDGSLHIDQSALTGESLAVQKKKGDVAYSSSIVKQGQMMCMVSKTGSATYIGRAAHLMSTAVEEGHFQKIINTIGNFLIVISVGMVSILLIVLSLKEDPVTHARPEFLEVLKRVVILTIAAIPLGLPTVMSVTMAVGAKQLAEKKVIVKRLPAIEELASVSILCSDKTGTLTLNKLTFDKPYLANIGSSGTNIAGDQMSKYTQIDLLKYAFMASEPGAEDPIEKAVRFAAEEEILALKNESNATVPGYKIISFTPFNPTSKITESTVKKLDTGETFRCIKGAPHVILHMCGGHEEAEAAVIEFSKRGLRALGVARTFGDEMTDFQLVGLISLLDPPRPDSSDTLRKCRELGVKVCMLTQVKMITGDHLIIAKEVASRLGINSKTILDSRLFDRNDLDQQALSECVYRADGFAGVVPEHKFNVVDILQRRNLLVAMTGDGVNDAPALKKANVGIAVHGCTEAARSAADIVLLAPGLSTIVDGIITSRQIFQRMRSYSVYRIASTIHFLIYFFISLLVFPEFYMSDGLIILIALLNDAATLVISVDAAKISTSPDKWRLGQLLTLSTVLGLFLTGFSFATYFIARDIYHLSPREVGTIMYLQISSCPHFVIFSTRVPAWFWENIPSFTFFVAIVATQLVAMLICIFGESHLGAVAVGPAWGFSIIATSFGCFFFLDAVKVAVLKSWSFDYIAALWPSTKNKEKMKSRQKNRELNYKIENGLDDSLQSLMKKKTVQTGN